MFNLVSRAYAVDWDNPSLSDLVPVYNRVYNTAILSVGGILIIWVIISGIRYLTAGGDEKAVAAARRSLTFAILGFVLVIGAYAVIAILGNLLGTITRGGAPFKIPKFTIPTPAP